MHVPMFIPNKMKTECCSVINPLFANVCKIPMEALELCMTAVKSAPVSTAIRGLLKAVIKDRKAALSRSGAIASLIMPIPMKRIPSPPTIIPTALVLSFFRNTTMTTPIKAIAGAAAPISSAISWPVIVVPIFAPIITPTACGNVKPALTNPTVMTVVALEL